MSVGARSRLTLEDRKVVQWRDYMDSIAAMTALSASGIKPQTMIERCASATVHCLFLNFPQ